MYISFIDSLK